MTIRPDQRLLDNPMTRAECRSCGAQVLACKSSWQQTSVQWNSQAQTRCHEWSKAAILSSLGDREIFLFCSELRQSILEMAHQGALPVPGQHEQTYPPQAAIYER